MVGDRPAADGVNVVPDVAGNIPGSAAACVEAVTDAVVAEFTSE